MISTVRRALGRLGLAGADGLRAETGLSALAVEEALAFLCRSGRAEIWRPPGEQLAEASAPAGPRAACQHCPLSERCAPRGGACPPDSQVQLYQLTQRTPA